MTLSPYHQNHRKPLNRPPLPTSQCGNLPSSIPFLATLSPPINPLSHASQLTQANLRIHETMESFLFRYPDNTHRLRTSTLSPGTIAAHITATLDTFPRARLHACGHWGDGSAFYDGGGGCCCDECEGSQEEGCDGDVHGD